MSENQPEASSNDNEGKMTTRRSRPRDPSPHIGGKASPTTQEAKSMSERITSKRDESSVGLNAKATEDVSNTEGKLQPKQVRIQKSTLNTILRILLQGTIHFGCIFLYLIPFLTPNEFGGPTMDEIHVMSEEQKDIHDPDATWRQIFTNDYWGRPMNSPSSHKSWRPLTILSFRFLKGPFTNLATQSLQQLTVHRIVNALCHAAAGEIIGQLATQLFPIDNPTSSLFLQLIVKVFFCLHPTHVEVTANAANRSHIIAVLLGVVLCFPAKSKGIEGTADKQTLKVSTPLWLFCISLVSGYLSSETFLMMVPGIMVTMTVLTFQAQEEKRNSEDPSGENRKESIARFVSDYLFAIITILPRLVMLAFSAVAYYGGRWYLGALDIPTGLIRPAENPFFPFEGEKRIRNYLYVITVHLGKQWGFILPQNFGGDPLGFSHEYGYNCVPEIQTWEDRRLVFGVGFHLCFAVLLSVLLIWHRPRDYFGLVAMHWSWTLGTLFSISGLVKVGTFISDRIAVPSTIVVSLWIGRIFHRHVTESVWKRDSFASFFRPLQAVLCLWWLIGSYTKVHDRALEWMDSISLMQSGLVTCPQFAKLHLEVSKIYSGLYPSLLDLKRSRHHIDTARAIDPDFCDVHKQYLFMGLREDNYREVEEALPKALICPFTSGGTEQIWHTYWNQLLSSAPQGSQEHHEIQLRYQAAFAIVQEGIKQRQAEEEANGLLQMEQQ